MFLHVCVCPRGMHCRWYPSMPCSRSRGGMVSQHALQVSRPTPRGEVEGSGWGGVSRPTPGGVPAPRRGCLLRGVSRPTLGEDACSRGSAPRGVPAPGGACSGGLLPGGSRPPYDGYCCGQYASYWNAFLFWKNSLGICIKSQQTLVNISTQTLPLY